MHCIMGDKYFLVQVDAAIIKVMLVNEAYFRLEIGHFFIINCCQFSFIGNLVFIVSRELLNDLKLLTLAHYLRISQRNLMLLHL
jgi:hypothetical protein